MENPSRKTEKYIKTLYLLMQLSRKAYAKYLQNKIYLHASAILAANQKIYQHIISNLDRVPSEIEDEVLDIINHYDIWMLQFREFEKLKKPDLKDEFIFYHIDENCAFPKDAEKTIFNYYQQSINTFHE